MGGPEMAPIPPYRSDRPGGAVAVLFRARGEPGPRDGPPYPPIVRTAPAEPWRSSFVREDHGAPSWPPIPPYRSDRPGGAAAARVRAREPRGPALAPRTPKPSGPPRGGRAGLLP